MRRLFITALAFSVVSGAAAQQAPLVDIRTAPLAEVREAPKDAAAKRALLMLGDRLKGLPREIEGMDLDPADIDAGWRILTGGFGFRFELDGDNPLFAVTSAPSGGAEGILARLGVMLGGGDPDRIEIAEDGAILFRDADIEGLRLVEARDGERSILSLRTEGMDAAPVTVERHELPATDVPILSASIELGRLLATVRDEMEREEPELAARIAELGVLNAGNARATFAVGSGGGLASFSGRLTDARPWLGRFVGEAELDAGTFAVVPRDATRVYATCLDLGWILQVVEMVGNENDQDYVAQVRDGFGIDLDRGVLNNVGPRWVYYQAESTGGGGILSAVLVAELRDPEAFTKAQTSAMTHANQLAASLGRGYGRTREWRTGDTAAYTITFPGLPVPVEPSWAVAGNRLIVALSPIGLVGAVGQLAAADSVADNPLFAEAVLESLPRGGVIGVSFVDTARFAARGYGTANLAASALANAVRQPFNDAAEPGLIMPAFGQFMEGIVSTSSVASWDGDSIVMKGSADGSVLVQTAAYTGEQGVAALLSPGLSLGTVLPALGQARESAKQLVGMTQVRSVVMGSIMWAQDNPGKPATTADLIEAGMITPDMLDSPVADAWDGNGDIVLRTKFPEGNDLGRFDPQLIVAMDRAAYITWHDPVNVGFSDGRVEALSRWEIDELLNAEGNAGLREEFKLDGE
jgi:hypothetical protein